jgi:hypothetical protein
MKRPERLLILVAALTIAALPAGAQTFDPKDLNGVWNMAGSNDLTDHVLPGEEISFTEHGAHRFRTVDLADAPANRCLPNGLQRSMLRNSTPFQIVMGPGVIAILFENGGNFRIIYMDGRGHPEDIHEYPTWFGHSIGRWEGNALVVDSVGFNGKTHMDIGGLEHSDKLHLIERFEKTGPDTVKWTVTVEDPEFFTKPWRYGSTMERDSTPVMPAFCQENERDAAHMMPTIGARSRNKAVLKFPPGF